MLPITVLLAFNLLPGTVVRSDGAVLNQVREAVLALDDKKISFVRFEHTLKPSDATLWQRLLRRVPANSENYAALSFAMAYYGVDYERNIRRLLRPYRMWSSDVGRWAKEYPYDQPESLVDLDFAWFSMNLLYLKHHDLKSLGTWLDLELSGHWAEGSGDTLGELWKRHETDMLRAAAGSRSRNSVLAGALVLCYLPDDTAVNRNVMRSLIAELHRRTHDRDLRVALAARRLIPEVQAQIR